MNERECHLDRGGCHPEPECPLPALLDGLEGVPFGDWAGVRVRGLCTDSRQARPGDLFIALPGQHTHGMRFLEKACERGIAAAIVPQGWSEVGTALSGPGALPPWAARLAGLAVADPRRALAEVSARFYGYPARSLFVVGVTGTNGKSTFVHMAAQILEAGGMPAGIWSTPVVDSGLSRFRPGLTTPDPPQLHRFFREVFQAGRRHACIEVSSHGLAQGRVAGVDFAVGAVTNLSADHLDFHGDMEKYAAVKESFVRALGPEGVCLLNADEARVRAMARSARGRVVLYGFSPQAHLRALDPEYGPGGSRMRLRLCGLEPLAPDGDVAVQVGIPGRHNVLNALAALGAGLVAGVPLEAACGALARLQAPARRLETLRVGPYTVISDVAMNEASYEAVMETVGMAYPGRPLVVVSAVRGNRGPAVNAAVAGVLARWNRRLSFAPLVVSLSCSHVQQYEADYRVRPEEAEAFVQAAEQGGLPCRVFEELPDAIAWGVGRLCPGGVLLLLGTFGMDDGATIAERLLRDG
mgnify:CR=1 FL=1